MNAPEFFIREELETYAKLANTRYDGTVGNKNIYNSIKEKLSYLGRESLGSDFEPKYHERPNKQAGKGVYHNWKDYILVGFDHIIPELQLRDGNKANVFLKFVVFFDGGERIPYLGFDIDVNNKQIFKDEFVKKKHDESNEAISIDDLEANYNSWEKLLERIKPLVEKNISIYKEVVDHEKKKLNPSTKEEPKNPTQMNTRKKHPLNQILYGPPGTGKTYQTAQMAVEICGVTAPADDRAKIKERFDELKKEGRVSFVTFHQSFGYEDFIEGIKPIIDDEEQESSGELGYTIEDGVFKRIATKAKDSKVAKIKDKTQSTDERYNAFKNYLKENNIDYVKQKQGKECKIEIVDEGIYSFPRKELEKNKETKWLLKDDQMTGLIEHFKSAEAIKKITKGIRSFNSSIIDPSVAWAVFKAFNEWEVENFGLSEEKESYEDRFEQTYAKLKKHIQKLPEGEYFAFKSAAKGGLFRITDISNDEDIKTEYKGYAKKDEQTEDMKKEIFRSAQSLQKSKLKEYYDKVKRDGAPLDDWDNVKEPDYGYINLANAIIEFEKEIPESENSTEEQNINHVIIIDEINRGNIAEIFGELITLIEPDKRLGEKNALTATLPYSKDDFGVPPNLYIIGTMNTADRSVEALDSALRRRFSFKEVMPDSELLIEVEVAEFSIQTVLETINKRIEKLLDRDHTIGHSYFFKLKSDANKEQTLCDIFNDNIVPLLQEYFYGDYGKIGLVLGSGIVKEQKNENGENLFAGFEYDDKSFLDDKKSYELKKAEPENLSDILNALLNQ